MRVRDDAMTWLADPWYQSDDLPFPQAQSAPYGSRFAYQKLDLMTMGSSTATQLATLKLMVRMFVEFR